ncbi:MAG: hypothetical protein WBY88_16370 [Desulfosarcina sp.]
MLYIGHFSFDEIDLDGNPKHGYFSCLVDADSPDDATAKFGSHIKSMQAELEEMAGMVNVYIEEILGVKTIPAAPIITRLQSSDGEFPESISYTLPGVIGEDVTAYGFAPDVEIHDRPTDDSFIQAEPFITFER